MDTGLFSLPCGARRGRRPVLILLGLVLLAVGSSSAPAQPPPAPLQVEARIGLGAVKGRIDHLAADPVRHRVFVAELGNDAVSVVDVVDGRVLRRLGGVREPQGVAYLPQLDRLYVASGRDGTVHAFAGESLGAAGTVDLGDDADNLRIDTAGPMLYAGSGSGTLTALDPATLGVRRSVKLPGHPESFQLESRSGRAYVNVPDAGSIVVVDRSSGSLAARWSTARRRANFPMALEEEGHRLFVAFRQPAWLQVYDTGTGREVAGIGICGDADDVFMDRRRQQLYVTCGEGFVDVLKVEGSALTRAGRLVTGSGARTGLYSAEADRLYVPVRDASSGAVALWVIRPVD